MNQTNVAHAKFVFFSDNNIKSYLKPEIRELVTGQCHRRPGQIFEIELIVRLCFQQATKLAIITFF